MSGRIDHVVDILDKTKNDKRTLFIVAGCVISFGVAIGSIAVYERLIKELGADNGESYFRNDRKQ